VDPADAGTEELRALDRRAERAPAELFERRGDPLRRGVVEDIAYHGRDEPPALELLGDQSGTEAFAVTRKSCRRRRLSQS